MRNTKKPIDISTAEWLIMEVVWEHKQVSAQQVTDYITKDTQWAAATVKTLINRLKEKGYLDYKVDGRAYLYRPTIKRSDCVQAEANTFLKKLFAGNLKPMLAHFAEEHDLSDKDIKELQAIISKKRK